MKQVKPLINNNAVRFIIKGTVQGVGFRPAVKRLCDRFNYIGWIKNNAHGVEIVLIAVEAQDFINMLMKSLPPLAQIDSITYQAFTLNEPLLQFDIIGSEPGLSRTKISEDTAICTDCVDELFNPADRFYLYPFISCSNCGPRYSDTINFPYDRVSTAFNKFQPCNECNKEYHDINNRRYYTQNIACHNCGPKLSADFEYMAMLIKEGKIIALKGNSGYHLILDAKNSEAIANIRQRKQRPNKPFALMALNLESIEQYVKLNNLASNELISRSAPIVVLEKNNEELPEIIAPGLNSLGFMLPNSGIDYLLFYHLLGKPEGKSWLRAKNNIVLIVTSANLSGGCIIAQDDMANKELTTLADLIVNHNKTITIRCDDSVSKPNEISKNILRLARGYTPKIITLKTHSPVEILALGSTLKNTICLLEQNEAIISQDIGNITNYYSYEYFKETIYHLQKLSGIKPKIIALDLHPDFYPDELLSNSSVPVIRVQHHFAHMASVIAEKHLETDCLGLILDGYGYGLDKNAWGGELISYRNKAQEFFHIGQLHQIYLPGGDIATNQPWRIALGLCYQLGFEPPKHLMAVAGAEKIYEILRSTQVGKTSSCGRLFDGISALANICLFSTYEAEAAMRLESLITNTQVYYDSWKITTDNKLDLSILIKYLMCLTNPIQVANIFVGTLAKALSEWVFLNAQNLNIHNIVLNGGCFQNEKLLLEVCFYLKQYNLNIYIPGLLPFNDNGVSLGQAFIAQQKFLKGHVLCV